MRARKLTPRELAKHQTTIARGRENAAALELLEHIAAITNELVREGQSHNDTLRERDRYSDAISETAAALGCPEEWSNAHDHDRCIQENAADVVHERDELKKALGSEVLQALLTRLREVHPDDVAPSLKDLRAKWIRAKCPGLV